MTPLDLILWLGIIAGAATSLGIIWTKILKPFGRGVKRVVEVHEIIVNFPSWQDNVDRGLEDLKDLMEQHAGNTRLHRF